MVQKVGKINCVLRKGEEEMGDRGRRENCVRREREKEYFIRINLKISSCLV